MIEDLQTTWEKEAAKVMAEIYRVQLRRILRKFNSTAATDDDGMLTNDEALRREIDALFKGENDRVRLQVLKLLTEMSTDVMDETLVYIDREPEDLDRLVTAVNEFVQVVGVDFSKTMNENSLKMVYSYIDVWLDTSGMTQADLFARMEKSWNGRAKTAAVTEVTRMVNKTTALTFEEAGIERFGINTRNDDRVRPHHSEYAAEGERMGGYPMDRTDRIPPFTEARDIGCRCTIYAIV